MSDISLDALGIIGDAPLGPAAPVDDNVWAGLQARLECDALIERARLAYRFATGTLTQGDAEDIVYMVQPLTGWFPLETISVDSLIESVGYRWANPVEEIAPLAEQACERVASKWDSTGDIASAAEDRATDLIAEYAEREGIELIEGERDAVPQPLRTACKLYLAKEGA
jgi:hypothetical protein